MQVRKNASRWLFLWCQSLFRLIMYHCRDDFEKVAWGGQLATIFYQTITYIITTLNGSTYFQPRAQMLEKLLWNKRKVGFSVHYRYPTFHQLLMLRCCLNSSLFWTSWFRIRGRHPALPACHSSWLCSSYPSFPSWHGISYSMLAFIYPLFAWRINHSLQWCQ